MTISIEQLEDIDNDIESALLAADRQASSTTTRYDHDRAFALIRESLCGSRNRNNLSHTLKSVSYA